jgi:catechol 2,3-dioxygenase-like lactoylglutathione lyase family enzyme
LGDCTAAGCSSHFHSTQELSAWNPSAGGIRAVYFRDPDGHPLELIQFPLGKGDPRWQDRDRLFLGIDHSAIAVRDTDASLAFYHDRLGLRIAGASENWGIEQERLSAVPGAHVRITTLRAATGPGVELLDYLMPGDGRPMPTDTTANDLWAEEIVMDGSSQAGRMLHDPDGHAVLVEPKWPISRRFLEACLYDWAGHSVVLRQSRESSGPAREHALVSDLSLGEEDPHGRVSETSRRNLPAAVPSQ